MFTNVFLIKVNTYLVSYCIECSATAFVCMFLFSTPCQMLGCFIVHSELLTPQQNIKKHQTKLAEWIPKPMAFSCSNHSLRAWSFKVSTTSPDTLLQMVPDNDTSPHQPGDHQLLGHRTCLMALTCHRFSQADTDCQDVHDHSQVHFHA